MPCIFWASTCSLLPTLLKASTFIIHILENHAETSSHKDPPPYPFQDTKLTVRESPEHNPTGVVVHLISEDRDYTPKKLKEVIVCDSRKGGIYTKLDSMGLGRRIRQIPNRVHWFGMISSDIAFWHPTKAPKKWSNFLLGWLSEVRNMWSHTLSEF